MGAKRKPKKVFGFRVIIGLAMIYLLGAVNPFAAMEAGPNAYPTVMDAYIYAWGAFGLVFVGVLVLAAIENLAQPREPWTEDELEATETRPSPRR